MPTPLGHTLTAAIIYTISCQRCYLHKKKQLRQGWGSLLFCILLASLPDIDFISISSGIHFSWENHHGPTHSIGFVILVILVVGIVARIFRGDWRQWCLISGLCVLSHVVMDLLITKRGLMLFYPLSTHRIIMTTGFPFGFSPEMGFVSFVVMSAIEEAIILGGILIVVWHCCRDRACPCEGRGLVPVPTTQQIIANVKHGHPQ
ncbi:metal-dependent hydrolase [Candidatus Desantisbacteria bacterium]|nr:metal-dependent hydrolase [Candidatus Desantisbacteria bacterium]